jgi:hypothetical protein
MEETTDLDRKVSRLIGDMRSIGTSCDEFLAKADALSATAEEFPAVRALLAPLAGPTADLRRRLLVGAATLKRLADTLDQKD